MVCPPTIWWLITWRGVDPGRMQVLKKIPISQGLVTLLHICGVNTNTTITDTARNSATHAGITALSANVAALSANIVESNSKCSSVSRCFAMFYSIPLKEANISAAIELDRWMIHSSTTAERSIKRLHWIISLALIRGTAEMKKKLFIIYLREKHSKQNICIMQF